MPSKEEETARHPSATKMTVQSSKLVSNDVIATENTMPPQTMTFSDKENSHTNLPQKSTSIDDELTPGDEASHSKLNTNREKFNVPVADDLSATHAVQVTESQQCHDNYSTSVPLETSLENSAAAIHAVVSDSSFQQVCS